MSEPGKLVTFEDVFGRPPQVTAAAPGRVNLLGDHTDYNAGFVLPTAIAQQTTVQLAESLGGDEVYSANLHRHVTFQREGPLPDFTRYVGGCLRVLADEGFALPPLQFWIHSTVPLGGGLSSSAALEVATLRALDQRFGLGLDPVRVAQLAQRAEVEHAGVACGIMDQMAASLASCETMLFLDTLTLERRLVRFPKDSEILIVHSGVERELTGSGYNRRRHECEAAAAALRLTSLREVVALAEIAHLPTPLQKRARHVFTENARVIAALSADAVEFGRLMNASHESLRDDYDVSVPAVDRLVSILQAQPEVLGARMTGAGFGGACVALVKRNASAGLRRRLQQHRDGARELNWMFL